MKYTTVVLSLAALAAAAELPVTTKAVAREVDNPSGTSPGNEPVDILEKRRGGGGGGRGGGRGGGFRGGSGGTNAKSGASELMSLNVGVFVAGLVGAGAGVVLI